MKCPLSPYWNCQVLFLLGFQSLVCPSAFILKSSHFSALTCLYVYNIPRTHPSHNVRNVNKKLYLVFLQGFIPQLFLLVQQTNNTQAAKIHTTYRQNYKKNNQIKCYFLSSCLKMGNLRVRWERGWRVRGYMDWKKMWIIYNFRANLVNVLVFSAMKMKPN